MKLKENLTLQFIVFYIISVCYALAISFIFDGNFCNTNNNSNNIPSFDTIFLRYSLGAILETFFLNFLVILIFRTIPFFRKNFLWLLFLSSIPFTLLHYRCIYYIFIVYPMDVVLNLYYLSIYKKTDSHPISITLVTLLHFLINVSTYTIAMLLGKIQKEPHQTWLFFHY